MDSTNSRANNTRIPSRRSKTNSRTTRRSKTIARTARRSKTNSSTTPPDNTTAVLDNTPATLDNTPATLDNTPIAEATRTSCPKCGYVIDTSKSSVSIHRGARCPECGKWFLVRLRPDKSRYVRGLGTTANGNDTLDIGDETADLLRGINIDEAYEVVADRLEQYGRECASTGFIKKFGKDTPWESYNIHAFLHNKYWDKNVGMQRMNLGNILRAAHHKFNTKTK